ncbi:MAG: hypothetical protein U0797_03240 [Gemmataceae bacterium]
MELLAPDILELTRQLSPAVSGGAALVGLGLWLYGGHSHRFWLALLLTVAAGVAGLSLAKDFAVQPLVAGLLLALAAGSLALALARISVFVAGGFAGLMLTRMAAPDANEFIAFLLGGLVGIAFYQLWITAMSSALGTLLLGYGSVSLLDKLGRLDGVDWAKRNTPLINWGFIGLTVLGILVQVLFERYRIKRAASKKKRDKEKKEEEAKKAAQPPPPPPAPPPAPPPPKLPWWKKSLFSKKAA